MKRLPILILCIVIVSSLNAQIVFLEDFDGVPGPTAGGAGTYQFPAGWSLRNVDNNTPDGQVAYVNEGWERREDFKFNIEDSCAFSTSWYAPAGTANDFMWTPLIGPLPTNCELSWNAVAYDGSFPDGYEVRIMTVPPTGGTGVIGNQLTNSTVIFSTAAENTSWTARSVNLNAYTGQTVYIGFRNNSTDKFILLIDDIKVEAIITYDAQITTAASYEYSMRPLSQTVNVALDGTIRNNGINPLTNVSLTARIYNSSNVLIHTENSNPLSTLSPGTSSVFTLTSWVPSQPDNYTIKYFPSFTETDIVTSNDTLLRSVTITDSVYARDDNTVISGLGIGTGNGYMGQAFTIHSTTDLTSITASYQRGYTGRKYAFVIWNTIMGGTPNAIIASTDTLLYPDDNAYLTVVPVYGGRKTLMPGNYVVTAIEFDSTLSLAQTSEIFTPGKMWVSWSVQPWTNLETFGSPFRKPFYIRMNVSTLATLPVKLVSFSGNNTPAGNILQWTVAEQESIRVYEVEKSTNGSDFIKIGAVQANNRPSFTYSFTDADVVSGSSFYRLKIIEDNKSSYSKTILIRLAASSTVSISPNPASQVVTLRSRNLQLLNTEASILNLQGMQVKQLSINQLPFSIDIRDLSAGAYLIRFHDKSVIKVVKM